MDKLLIVWSSGEIDVAKKLVLMYGSVILPRGYWDEAHLMVWGPSAKLLAENTEVQEMFAKVLESGVTASACVVCADGYRVSDTLRERGIELKHTGEFFTQALKNDWKVVTF